MSDVTRARPVELALRREGAVIAAAIAATLLLSWGYLVDMSVDMGGMSGMAAMAPPHAWSAGYAATMAAMWVVMMIGMMVPTAAPMILLYARAWRRRPALGRVYPPTAGFAAGYLVAWSLIALTATGLQYLLERAMLLTPMMAAAGPGFAGAVLLLAGAYQLTPQKGACLDHCRSPAEFLARHWRPGSGGAFRMGLEHGAWCVGCCWAVMGLLFVFGVMDLVWIAGLTLLVLAEKLAPFGHVIGRIAGLAMLGGGAAYLWSWAGG
ncbi:MAG TPA: DUF2182 domain-containing protein [Alphaproteobacteria bacterium]|nr:DUF2182 domain-containing protein [Alphaproteobacteria bacterium]